MEAQNINYLERIPDIEGKNTVLIYNIECLPFGMTIEDILDLNNRKEKIPYVQCDLNPWFIYED